MNADVTHVQSFINISNWEEDNIVSLKKIEQDFAITDDNNNAIIVLENGHIKTKNFDSEHIQECVQLEEIEQDFSISDENEKRIVIFDDGHIITKKFDSRKISQKKLEGVKFSILGDSISTYQGFLVSDTYGYTGDAYRAYYGNSEYGSPLGDVNLTWWKKLIEKSGMTLI